MKKYIVKRLLQLIPILIGITLLSFILMQASAMDAVDVMEDIVAIILPNVTFKLSFNFPAYGT